jgi:hypothetical protein
MVAQDAGKLPPRVAAHVRLGGKLPLQHEREENATLPQYEC